MQERERIVAMREEGYSYQSIAEALHHDYETVRKIDHRYRESGNLKPAYDNCRQCNIRSNQAVYEHAIELKQSHPTWGAGLIWVELATIFDEILLPSERTLQRWFKRAGVQNPPTDRRPRAYVARGKRSHEVWAIDAKEQIKLADGSFVSWLSVIDEGSGAILGASLFPHSILGEDQSDAGEVGFTKADDDMGTSGTDTDG